MTTHNFRFDDCTFRQRPCFGQAQVSIREQIKETHIGHDVSIASNAIVRAGVSVGDGAVIGEGALVTADVPPYAIVVGAPARICRYRFSGDTIDRLLLLKWWELPFEYLTTLPLEDIEACIERLTIIRSDQSVHVGHDQTSVQHVGCPDQDCNTLPIRAVEEMETRSV